MKFTTGCYQSLYNRVCLTVSARLDSWILLPRHLAVGEGVSGSMGPDGSPPHLQFQTTPSGEKLGTVTRYGDDMEEGLSRDDMAPSSCFHTPTDKTKISEEQHLCINIDSATVAINTVSSPGGETCPETSMKENRKGEDFEMWLQFAFRCLKNRSPAKRQSNIGSMGGWRNQIKNQYHMTLLISTFQRIMLWYALKDQLKRQWFLLDE
ncbi:uncharacterized protein LOC130268641 [Hyla sarda]|uniref:uncharacterized protein LOC130268641 n=1 Tax=Hyla sarda TaxID=327740 RepID=UPI0024C43D7D|nr:uncharacterized protein LOC130268641 [Hyla sarda]